MIISLKTKKKCLFIFLLVSFIFLYGLTGKDLHNPKDILTEEDANIYWLSYVQEEIK